MDDSKFVVAVDVIVVLVAIDGFDVEMVVVGDLLHVPFSEQLSVAVVVAADVVDVVDKQL